MIISKRFSEKIGFGKLQLTMLSFHILMFPGIVLNCRCRDDRSPLCRRQ